MKSKATIKVSPASSQIVAAVAVIKTPFTPHLEIVKIAIVTKTAEMNKSYNIRSADI